MSNPFDLDRFIIAQRDVFDIALSEIRNGAKQSHWMWFIFPQIAGLGHSATAQYYAIRSLSEACAYLDHDLLGPRLRRCVEALQTLPSPDAIRVFGPVDAMKLRSSLTLFLEASGDMLFSSALRRWFEGRKDPKTLALLQPR